MSAKHKSASAGTQHVIEVNGSDSLVLDGSGIVSGYKDNSIEPTKLTQRPTLGITVATTSGTAIDITGIPSWVNELTVLFNAVSTAGVASGTLLQLGTAGGVVNSGYVSVCVSASATNIVSSFPSTVGFAIQSGSTGENVIGAYTFRRFSGNTWVGTIAGNRSGVGMSGGGNLTLSGPLDRIRLTSVNGTDTFDAGSINIYYSL